MDDKNVVFLDWNYNLWDEGIENFYPISGRYFNAKVTGVTPDYAWLVTEDGVECFLFKNKVAGTRFQIQDLRDELTIGQSVKTKVIGYNKSTDKPQLKVSINLEEV